MARPKKTLVPAEEIFMIWCPDCPLEIALDGVRETPFLATSTQNRLCRWCGRPMLISPLLIQGTNAHDLLSRLQFLGFVFEPSQSGGAA